MDQIYSGTPCTNCSLRFGEEALRAEEGKKSRYARHLDWHFRQNRRLKAKPVSSSSSSASSGRGGKKFGLSAGKEASTSSPSIITAQRRSWYYPLELWILYKEVNDDLEEEAAAAAAFFDSANAAAAAAGSSSTPSSAAALQLLATFDWSRFKASIVPYEAFMEVVNGSNADLKAGPSSDEAKRASLASKCSVVAESAFTEITCALCQELLEQRWGEEEEEWRVENAVRYREEEEGGPEENHPPEGSTKEEEEEKETKPKEPSRGEGRIYHPLCLKDYLLQKEKQKKLSEQEQEMEKEEEEEEDEFEGDEEEDEDLGDLEEDGDGETSTNSITDNRIYTDHRFDAPRFGCERRCLF